ncbi:hypothetical protein PBY51_019601 [Eleginops maclovinus]|uniref:Uncharacterized protein n=1 Tax=Eleginops maclovinus TaxID=56733 RepID=A0AAN7YBC5_ELEMC|nr:hypothetical protein PBY51_019601 [Eleginops maclovinus]
MEGLGKPQSSIVFLLSKQTGVQGQFLQAQEGKTLENHRSEWGEEGWADKDRSWRKEKQMEEWNINREVMPVCCANRR